MKSAKSFKKYFESSFKDAQDEMKAKELSREFITDFIYYTPLKLDLLESYLSVGQIDHFYNSLADLKYLIEFSDNLNRYWHVLRAYSGALAKLKADLSVKGSKKLHSYYFEKYGDRRTLRDEHWFEKKRWEFLDELQDIYTESDLKKFILKYQSKLSENMAIYKSFLLLFIENQKNLQSDSISVINSKA